jgi:hypothetical protein
MIEIVRSGAGECATEFPAGCTNANLTFRTLTLPCKRNLTTNIFENKLAFPMCYKYFANLCLLQIIIPLMKIKILIIVTV